MKKGRKTRRTWSKRLPAMSVLLVSAILYAIAFMSRGMEVTQVSVNDGGIWVTNQDRKLVDHLNYDARMLDGRVSVKSASFDIGQAGVARAMVRTRALCVVDQVAALALPRASLGDKQTASVTVVARHAPLEEETMSDRDEHVGVAPMLPGYQWIRHLGSGGFADVYLCRQEMPSRDVAVKIARLDRGSEAQGDIAREADVMALVSGHPAVEQLYGAGTAQDGGLSW